jgi:hypothetical protein
MDEFAIGDNRSTRAGMSLGLCFGLVLNYNFRLREMGFLPEETVIAGILAAFAAHPDLIPPQLLQPRADLNSNDIYLLPDVRILDRPIVISKAKPEMETSRNTCSIPCRSRSLR